MLFSDYRKFALCWVILQVCSLIWNSHIPVIFSLTLVDSFVLFHCLRAPARGPADMEGPSTRSDASLRLAGRRDSGRDTEADPSCNIKHFRVCRFIMETGNKRGVLRVGRVLFSGCILNQWSPTYQVWQSDEFRSIYRLVQDTGYIKANKQRWSCCLLIFQLCV